MRLSLRVVRWIRRVPIFERTQRAAHTGRSHVELSGGSGEAAQFDHSYEQVGAERSVGRYAPLSRLGVPALRRRRRLRTVRGWRGGSMRESGDCLLRYPSDDNRSSARGQRQLVLQWRRILRVRAIVISVNVLAARTFAV